MELFKDISKYLFRIVSAEGIFKAFVAILLVLAILASVLYYFSHRQPKTPSPPPKRSATPRYSSIHKDTAGSVYPEPAATTRI